MRLSNLRFSGYIYCGHVAFSRSHFEDSVKGPEPASAMELITTPVAVPTNKKLKENLLEPASAFSLSTAVVTTPALQSVPFAGHQSLSLYQLLWVPIPTSFLYLVRALKHLFLYPPDQLPKPTFKDKSLKTLIKEKVTKKKVSSLRHCRWVSKLNYRNVFFFLGFQSLRGFDTAVPTLKGNTNAQT